MPDDHDHAHRQRVAEPELCRTSPVIWLPMQDRHEVDRPAGQLVGRRLRAERVAEQQDHRAEQRRREDRQRDAAPVLAACVAPMFSDASRHSCFRPSMAGAMIRTISGNWKYR